MATTDSPRLALVGAASLLGKEIKERLAESGFPSSSIQLLDLEEVAGLVTDYGEEARVMIEVAEEELLQPDIVCFCGSAQLAGDHLPAVVGAGGVAIDCTGALADDPEVLLSLPAAGRAPDGRHGGAVALPSAPTQLLGITLAALQPPIEGSATVLIPASERGDAGLEELARQSAAVLNLDEPPSEVFGRQLAFDVWLYRDDVGLPPLAHRVTAQLRRLGLPTVQLCLLQAPVFHSIAATIHLVDAPVESIVESLAEAGIPLIEGLAPPADAIDSPMRTAGISGLRVGGVWPDDEGGTWLWATMDNIGARASAAVATIQALLPTRSSGT